MAFNWSARAHYLSLGVLRFKQANKQETSPGLELKLLVLADGS